MPALISTVTGWTLASFCCHLSPALCAPTNSEHVSAGAAVPAGAVAGKSAFEQYFELLSFSTHFPVPFSPWQIKRAETELNEAVTFALENLENKEKITAKLFNNNYIPEFYAAVKLHKANTPIEATVYKITPHGIYVNLVTDKVQAKIPFKEGVKINDAILVKIVYLSPAKIIIEGV